MTNSPKLYFSPPERSYPMKRSLHKKETFEDKFGRKYYCQNSKARMIRYEKHANNKKFRRAFNPNKEDSK